VSAAPQVSAHRITGNTGDVQRNVACTTSGGTPFVSQYPP
jgi:hypothetical protein